MAPTSRGVPGERNPRSPPSGEDEALHCVEGLLASCETSGVSYVSGFLVFQGFSFFVLLAASSHHAGPRFHLETLIMYKLSSRKCTTHNYLY